MKIRLNFSVIQTQSIFKRLARNLSRRQMEARVKENQERECIARKRLPASDKRFKLYTTDIKNEIPEIPDNSVDLIVTDPPYKSRFIDCYDWLGNFASRVLKHGGCLLVLCGQHHLYEEMSRLNKYLKYYWMLSYTMTGSKSGIGKQRDVFIHWKPVLWYVKGVYTRGYVSDLCSPESGNIGKSLHIWQQSEMGIRSIMQKFVNVGDVICDPFCGSSTTGVIALEMECNQYIGIDKEQTCIDISRSRLIDRIKELSKKDKIA